MSTAAMRDYYDGKGFAYADAATMVGRLRDRVRDGGGPLTLADLDSLGRRLDGVYHEAVRDAQREEALDEDQDEGCGGCGRVDPCGVHYDDCTLLEPGDLLVSRTGAWEWDEATLPVYIGPNMQDPEEETTP